MATTRRYSFGEYTLDIDRGALLRAGADVALRPKSYAVLCYLVEHHGHLVTKQELLDAIWGHVVVTEGTLTHCLVDIRRALADESQQMLRTVRGRGYLFDAPVEGLDGGDDDSVAMPPQLRPAPELRRAGRLLLPLSAIFAAAVFWWIAVTGTGRSTIAEAPQQVTAARSIAVLPFLDLSPEQDQEYFSDGISEEILNRLSSFRELHVIARTSSFAFKDSGHDIPRLTSLLGVRYVLQGSVRKDGSALRISAQLVDSSGRHLWSETFDRDISGIFAIQTEIAEEVALRIFPQLSPPSAITTPPDVEAYQHYLIGREAIQKGVTWRYPPAIEQFSRAIEIDPAFADAYAERAIVILLNGFWTNDHVGDLDRAEQDVQAALSLDNNLARAYAAQAMVVDRRPGPRSEVERVLRHALARDPNMVDARLWLFRTLDEQGQRAVALGELERALRLDPLAPDVVGEFARIEAKRGDFKGAERRLRRLLELIQPSDIAYRDLWMLYVQTGRLADAVEIGKGMILATVAQGGRPARYYALIASYSHLGLWAKAEDWQNRYVHEYPDDYIIHLYPMWVHDVATGNLVMQGRFREALELTRNKLESFGTGVTEARRDVAIHFGILQALAGEHRAAIRSLDHRVKLDLPFGSIGADGLQALAWAHLKDGASSRAAELLDFVEHEAARKQAEGYLHVGLELYVYALNAALRGMSDSALERLRAAVDAGWRGYYRAIHDPRWEFVRDDPRFASLMARVETDVERQREDVERREAEDDFVVRLETAVANEASRRGGENR